jgi:hypothetical protein
MKDTLADIVEAAGQKTTAALPQEGPVRGVTLASFDVVNPYAVGYARTEVARLIRGIDMNTREGIMNLIGNAIETGIPPRQAAKQIKNMIGLTDFQTQYVLNYENRLIADGASNVDAKVQRYADKVLGQRALTIARTETLAASNGGQQAAWHAAVDQGFLDRETEQIWIVTYDERLCEICAPMPEMDENQHVPIDGMFLTGDGNYVRKPPEPHPRCLTPDTKIEAIEKDLALRVPFRGWMNVIETGPRRLTIGTNHPVLTPRGFVPAHLLNEGDQVFCGNFRDRELFANPDKENRPTEIQQIFQTFRESRFMSAVVMPAAPEYLHGDGRFTNGEIEIIDPYGSLRNQNQARPDDVQQLMFKRRDSARIGFGSQSPSPFLFIGMDAALRRLMRSFDLLSALLRVHGSPFERFRCRLSAWFDMVAKQSSTESPSGYLKFLRQLILARTSDITLQRIGKVRRIWYVGHVYDLQSYGGLYFANGIIATNCRCAVALNL